MISSQIIERVRNPDVAATIADRLRMFLDEPLPTKGIPEDEARLYPGVKEPGPAPAIADPSKDKDP